MKYTTSKKIKPKKFIFVHLLNDYSGSPHVLSQVIDVVISGKCVDDVKLYLGSHGDGFLKDKSYTNKYFYRLSDNIIFKIIFFLLSQIILFCKLLKYRNEDISIYINTMLPFGAAIAGKLMKKKVIYHIHETSLKPKSFKSFLRYVISKTANSVIYVSKHLQKKESFRGINSKVIYNSLSRKFLKKAYSCEYEFNSKEFNILMVSSLKSYKGISEFIDIASMCNQQFNISCTLVLNANTEEIEKFFSNINVPANMSIFPAQHDLNNFYKKANIVLNLSKTDQWVETFGLTILEAMSYGVPTIVPPIGGPIELVRNGQDGYHLDSVNTEQIYLKILELNSDRNQCLLLSKSARKRSLNFSQDIFSKEIKNFLTNNC